MWTWSQLNVIIVYVVKEYVVVVGENMIDGDNCQWLSTIDRQWSWRCNRGWRTVLLRVTVITCNSVSWAIVTHRLNTASSSGQTDNRIPSWRIHPLKYLVHPSEYSVCKYFFQNIFCREYMQIGYRWKALDTTSAPWHFSKAENGTEWQNWRGSRCCL